MSAITSGVYHEPLLSRAMHQLVSGLASRLTRHAAAQSAQAAFAKMNAERVIRAREAGRVRALARSVERQSPGFAADLYAAAARHQDLDD